MYVCKCTAWCVLKGTTKRQDKQNQSDSRGSNKKNKKRANQNQNPTKTMENNKSIAMTAMWSWFLVFGVWKNYLKHIKATENVIDQT